MEAWEIFTIIMVGIVVLMFGYLIYLSIKLEQENEDLKVIIKNKSNNIFENEILVKHYRANIGNLKKSLDKENDVNIAKISDLKQFLPYYNVGDEITYRIDSDIHIGVIKRIETTFRSNKELNNFEWECTYIVVKKNVYVRLKDTDIIEVIKESGYKIT